MKGDDEPRVDGSSHAFAGLTVTRTREPRATSYRDDAPRDAIEISVRDDLAHAARLMTQFAVFWNAFVGLFLWGAPNAWPCLTPFIAAGLLLIYLTAVARFDRWSIAVAGGRLRARHRPLPWFGAFQVACRDVRSIEVEPVPDMENRRVVGHLDLVVHTDRATHRANMGAPHYTPRTQHIAALLREHLGLNGSRTTQEATEETRLEPTDDEEHEDASPTKRRQS